MRRITPETKKSIAENIRKCRMGKFPGRGGEKKCAEAFGVSPQQWSPWETGKRTPDELRLVQLAEFFGVTVDRLLQDNAEPPATFAAEHMAELTSENSALCPFLRIPRPGQPPVSNTRSLCWLAETLLGGSGGVCIKLHPDDAALFMEFWAMRSRPCSQKKNLCGVPS